MQIQNLLDFFDQIQRDIGVFLNFHKHYNDSPSSVTTHTIPQLFFHVATLLA